MTKLTAVTEGANRLGLREILQNYIDDQWTADHYTPEQCCDILFDQFAPLPQN